MSYNCEIVYRPRKENIVANYLSRALAVIDVGPFLEIGEATRQSIIWIPVKKRPRFLQRAYYISTGHLWEAKFFKFLRGHFYWKRTFKDAKQILVLYDICGRVALDFGIDP